MGWLPLLLLDHGDTKIKAGFLKATLSRLLSTASSLVSILHQSPLVSSGPPEQGFLHILGEASVLYLVWSRCLVSTNSMGPKHKFWEAQLGHL